MILNLSFVKPEKYHTPNRRSKDDAGQEILPRPPASHDVCR